ncbi:MAG TPA: hypothetical protein VMW56_32525 [Candidatus Margulisiibacteriota bacterium]|nr:hypothetical protein [Candidatus Margulisiibacteriota bacterium]
MPSGSPSSNSSRRFPWIGALLAFAAVTALRLYRLDDWPPHFHHDCGLFSWHAWRLLSGNYRSILESGYAGIPLIGHAWTALWAWLVGTGSLAAIRAPGVAGSLVAIAAGASIAWQLAPTPLAPLITIIVLGTNITFMAFSRMTAYMDPVAFQALAVAALLAAERRALWTVVVGAACAFSTLSYFSGRLTPLVCAGIGLSLVARRRLPMKRLVVAGLVAAALLAPQVWAIFHGWDWRGRIGVFCFLEEPNPHCPGTWEATGRVVRTFWNRGDAGTQYGGQVPLVMPVEAGALVIACLLSFVDAGLATLMAWAIGVLFIGAALTVDPPFFPRIVAALVPVSAAIGIVAARVAQRHVLATLAVACGLTLAVAQHLEASVRYCHQPEHWLLTMAHDILALPPRAPIAVASPERDILTCDHPFLLAFVQQHPCKAFTEFPLPPLQSGTTLYVHSPVKVTPPDVGPLQGGQTLAVNEYDRLVRYHIP